MFAWLQELREKLATAQQQVQAAMQDPSVCLAFLRPGRIIRVKEGQVGHLVALYTEASAFLVVRRNRFNVLMADEGVWSAVRHIIVCSAVTAVP